jgi:hypothetical protein
MFESPGDQLLGLVFGLMLGFAIGGFIINSVQNDIKERICAELKAGDHVEKEFDCRGYLNDRIDDLHK